MFEDFFEYVLMPVMLFVLFISLVLSLIYVPVVLYTDHECLQKGYPNSHVSIFMDRYCSNFDGAVTIKIDKIEK